MLHVVAPAMCGGLERVVHNLAASQRAAGARVAVVAIVTGAPGEMGEAFAGPLRADGVEVHTIDVPRRGYARERRAVAGLCERVRPAVVHTHGYRPDVVDSRVARTAGAASVTTVHGFTGGGLRNRCYEWLQRRRFRRLDAVVAVSRPLLDDLVRSGVSAERAYLVPNVWRAPAAMRDRAEARALLGIPADAFVAGWVGRLSPEKGPDVFLSALAALATLRDAPFHASILGDGAGRAACERQAADLGLGRRVRWHGQVPDAGALLGAFDVVVLSSRTEGTPMVLLEAMAAGVPVIASAVGGVPDLLRPGEGTLVPPDDPRALANAVADVHAHAAIARARAARAQARVRDARQVTAWVRRYREVYQEALTGMRPR